MPNPLYIAKRSAVWLTLTALGIQAFSRNGKGVAATEFGGGGNSLDSGKSNAIDNHRYAFSTHRELDKGGRDVLTETNTRLERRQDPGYTPPPPGLGPVDGIGDFASNGDVTPETGKPVPNHTLRTPAEMQAYLRDNFPQEKLRVDPSLLKDHLFFENAPVAHLSSYKLLEALKYYDPRDVYDALMSATAKDKLGFQSNPELAAFDQIRPNAGQSTPILLAYWALSNHYGYIADLPKVDSNPKTQLVGKTPFPPLLLLEGGSGAGGVEKHGGRAWINVATITDPAQLAARSYQQLLGAITNNKWRSAAGSGVLQQRLDAIGKSGYANYLNEIISESLTRQWDPGFTGLNKEGQANMNAVYAALSRGDMQLRDEDFVDGPTPESSAPGLEIVGQAVVGGDDDAMTQLFQRLERLLESGKVPASANQPNLQTELPRLLGSEGPTDPQGHILNAILTAPVDQLQAVLNDNQTMALLGEKLQSEHAVAYASALFNHALEHSDLIGKRDLLEWLGGRAGEPDTFSGQLWCCDLPTFARIQGAAPNQGGGGQLEHRNLRTEISGGSLGSR